MQDAQLPSIPAETALSDWLRNAAAARRSGTALPPLPADMNASPVRAAQSPLFPSCLAEQKQVRLFLTNDTAQPFQGIFSYFLAPTDSVPGAPLKEQVRVPAGKTTQILFFDRKEIRRRNDVLVLRVFDAQERCLCETRTVFCAEKALRLADPQLTLTPVLRAGQLFVCVRAARYARRILLHCDGGTFSENRFDLSAGEEKTVALQGVGTAFTESLSATSLFDLQHSRRRKA